MRSSEDKKATTIRLSKEDKLKLEKASWVSGDSESQVMAKALSEYCKNHGYDARYVVAANDSCYVLFKQESDKVTVLDQQVRNGVSLHTIQENYRVKYQAPIDLLVEGEPPR